MNSQSDLHGNHCVWLGNMHKPILLKDVPGWLLSSVQCSKQQSLWYQVLLNRFGQYTPIPAMQKELRSNAKRIRHLLEKELNNCCHMLSCSIKARTDLQKNAETLNWVWVCLVSSVFTGKRCAVRITFLYRLVKFPLPAHPSKSDLR